MEVEPHLEILNESGLRRRKRDVFPDESEKDREINCQGEPGNPGRQSRSVYAFRCCPACTKRPGQSRSIRCEMSRRAGARGGGNGGGGGKRGTK